jgi:hypothetical protein
MNDHPNNPPASQSVEQGVCTLLSNARQDIRHRYHQCEERIRKSPATAVLTATAAGYLLHRMPVRAILLTQVRVLSALTPPALLLFGAAKLYEVLQRQQSTKQE